MLLLVVVIQLTLVFENDEALFLALWQLAGEMRFFEVHGHALVVPVVGVVLVRTAEVALEVVLLEVRDELFLVVEKLL